MIICPVCGAPILELKCACRACGFVPESIDGFVAWAPEFANSNSGFHPEYFAGLAQVEAEHFWFRARNTLILWALRKYFPVSRSLLEVGCGTGFVLSGIAGAFPQISLVGSEIFTAGLAVASQRVPRAKLVQMDARRIPYVEEFDVVSAFDVIEHIKEDELVLQNLYRAVKPGGGCLITVPQHKWLWSPVDDKACHQRRYGARELHEKIEAAGFRILRTTSFVTLLLPAMLLSRLAVKYSGKSGGSDDLRLNPIINRLFEVILYFEQLFIRGGVRWPIGGSRLVVALKDAETRSLGGLR